MLAGVTQGSNQQRQQQHQQQQQQGHYNNNGQQQGGKWSTRFTQSSEPATMGECCFSCWCFPCAAALAKHRIDNSNGCHNVSCFSPCANIQFVRYEYGIAGVCGDDCCYGLWCFPCTVRQGLTETRLRGVPPHGGVYGTNRNEWAHSLFDCSSCSLCDAVCCCCCAAHSVHEKLQPASDSCCFDMWCTLPCAWYGQTRIMYGIVTDFPCIEDVLLPVICCPCALNRAKKQVQYALPRIVPPPRTAAEMGY